MDSEHYTCGTCKHGNLYDQCQQCEDLFESTRKPPIQAVKPIQSTQLKENK